MDNRENERLADAFSNVALSFIIISMFGFLLSHTKVTEWAYAAPFLGNVLEQGLTPDTLPNFLKLLFGILIPAISFIFLSLFWIWYNNWVRRFPPKKIISPRTVLELLLVSHIALLPWPVLHVFVMIAKIVSVEPGNLMIDVLFMLGYSLVFSWIFIPWSEFVQREFKTNVVKFQKLFNFFLCAWIVPFYLFLIYWLPYASKITLVGIALVYILLIFPRFSGIVKFARRFTKSIPEIVSRIFFPSNVIVIGVVFVLIHLRTKANFINDVAASLLTVLGYVVIVGLLKKKITDENKLYFFSTLMALIAFSISLSIFTISKELIFGALSLLVTTLVIYTIRPTWKISAHVAAVALVATVLSLIDIRFLLFYSLLPVLAYSRLKMRAHNKKQTAAGMIVGLTMPVLCFLLLGYCFN